jgi:GT2 family glycosyltransferase
MGLTLCCTTWKRYDLLAKLINSAEAGNTKPDRICIVDNGGSFWNDNPKVEIYRTKENLGVSAGDNYFFKNMIDDFIVVSNDDVELFPYTLTMFVQGKDSGDFLVTAGLPILNAFTLFSVNKKVIDTVGYFDESISPKYAYFEDNDFGRRINLAGLVRAEIPTSAFHFESGTIKSFNEEEKRAHNTKFSLARENYSKKWGGVPTKETTQSPDRGLYVGYIEHDIVRVK